MAEPYIWGSLNRSVTDATLVDQAIAEAVEAHNDDATSHLGADQSLQSHRASEIIDHRAESIVNDKLQPKTRAWTAIVDPESEYDYSTVQGAVEYVNNRGGGSVFVKRGRHIISGSMFVDGKTEIHGEGMGETILYSQSAGNATIDFAGGNYNSDYYIVSVTFMDGNGDYDDWESGPTGWLMMDDWELGSQFQVGFRFFFTGDKTERRVTYSDGFTGIQFSPQYTPDDINGDMETWYTYRLVASSKVVQVIGAAYDATGWNNPNFGLFDRDGIIIGNIESYDPVSQSFTLQDAWTGSTQFVQGFVGTGYGELNTMSGLTFEGQLGNMNLSVELDHAIRPLSVAFRECEFKGNNLQIGMFFDEKYRGRFERCTFRITRNTLFSAIHNVRMQDCKILFERASAQNLNLLGKCEVLDCLVTNKGYATAGYIGLGRGEFLISNCTLEINGERLFGQLNEGRLILTDSYINLLGAGNLTLRGRQIIVADSVIRASGAGRLIMVGNLSRLSALGNISSHPFTTTGLAAKIENNLIGAL